MERPFSPTIEPLQFTQIENNEEEYSQMRSVMARRTRSQLFVEDDHTPSSHTAKPKLINDPIHGSMLLDAAVVQLIDTREFQRLRSLQQLGMCKYVYPSATHTRFEHSIGVGYLANQWLVGLQQRQPEWNITDQEIRCVTLAATAHDLGHGPYSHMWEMVMEQYAEDNPHLNLHVRAHEEYSVEIFKRIYDTNQDLRNLLSEEEVDFVCDLIVGSGLHKMTSDDISKQKMKSSVKDRDIQNTPRYFLYEIVSNSFNDIDVDKFDYIQRDSYYTGVKTSFSHSRIFANSRIIGGHITFKINEQNTLVDLFNSRYRLFTRVYMHPKVLGLDSMIHECILSLGRAGIIDIERASKDLNYYLTLTDDRILTHLSSLSFLGLSISNPRTKEDINRTRHEKMACNLFDRFQVRDIYTLVDHEVMYRKDFDAIKPHFTTQSIVDMYKFEEVLTKLKANDEEMAREFLLRVEDNSFHLDASHIILKRGKVGWTSKEDNPLENVFFFNKHQRQRGFKISINNTKKNYAKGVSLVIPETVCEHHVLIFLRQPDALLHRVYTLLFRKFLTSSLNDSQMNISASQQIGSPVDSVPSASFDDGVFRLTQSQSFSVLHSEEMVPIDTPKDSKKETEPKKYKILTIKSDEEDEETIRKSAQLLSSQRRMSSKKRRSSQTNSSKSKETQRKKQKKIDDFYNS
ncbi:hypothetical protein PCE1_004032 [Barthelona sp. PCE]